MPGYLEEYGAGDEKRGRVIRWSVIAAVAVLVLSTAGYLLFRNYPEDKIAKAFVATLQQKNYQEAYRFWGCTAENPCRDYRFDKFLEDWGPQSPYADASNVRIGHPQLNPGALGWIRNVLGVQYSCDDGVIYHLNFGKGEPVLIYILRKERTIGFAPWPVCSPRIQM
jgi:hypothetical protein